MAARISTADLAAALLALGQRVDTLAQHFEAFVASPAAAPTAPARSRRPKADVAAERLANLAAGRAKLTGKRAQAKAAKLALCAKSGVSVGPDGRYTCPRCTRSFKTAGRACSAAGAASGGHECYAA